MIFTEIAFALLKQHKVIFWFWHYDFAKNSYIHLEIRIILP